jgi:PPP family 3-phenylpropionic acid transporter
LNTIGALWSMSVAAEVVVFLFIGRPLLDRIGPAHAAMIAAAAGALRWVIMAELRGFRLLPRSSHYTGLHSRYCT